MNLPAWLSLPVAVAVIFVALFIAAVAALSSLSSSARKRDLTTRIGQYGPQRRRSVVPDTSEGSQNLNSLAQDLTKRLMSPAAQGHLAERLDLGGVARKPAEWVLLGCGLGFVIAAALSLVTGNILIGVAVGALVGWLAMRMSLNFMIRRRRTAFGEQLPDLLQLMASALQSGFSLIQAMDAVVRDSAQPAAGEFARALAESKLGADLDECLAEVSNRMDSADLRWTVMAIRIQRSIGGNLAEVLMTIAGTMRERGFLRRQVKALSAEGRLSAYILVALPILVGGWLFLTNPKYMRPLYTTNIGLVMLVGAVVLLIVGALWMRKTIQLEV